jgi:hypothetical protein
MKLNTTAEGKAMTLAELAKFVEYAQMVGIPPDAELDGECGWKGQLRKVGVR